MARRLKQVMIILMCVGVIGICFNMIFGTNTVTYITTYTNQWGDTYYIYDFKAYMQNLTTQIQNTAKLELELPTREWETGEWAAISNNLALILDYLIFLINILVYPMRIGGYILQNMWALLGINNTIDGTSKIYWLYSLTDFMQNLVIPYV